MNRHKITRQGHKHDVEAKLLAYNRVAAVAALTKNTHKDGI